MDNTTEIWKNVGAPFSKYEVSNMGRVRNIRTQYISNRKKEPSGYIRVCLTSDDWKLQTCSVHRLVNQTFNTGKTEEKCYTDHINRIKHDNRACNLRWVSPQENANNANNARTSGKRKIDQFSFDGQLIRVWDSVTDIAKTYKTSTSAISHACRHNSRSFGFRWKYHEDTIEGEVWKEIIFSSSKIVVSSEGRVKYHNGRIDRGSNSIDGYRYIKPNNRSIAIHRLVCHAFLGLDLTDKNMTVRHKNRDKKDNRLSNLEIMTQKENNIEAAKYTIRNPPKKRVRRIDNNGNIKVYESASEAAKDIGTKTSGVSAVCRKSRTKHRGFKWEYLES